MELIQFRKDERQKEVAGYPGITKTCYVTQYRQRVMRRAEEIDWYDVDLYYVTEEWTEWQDMPQ